MSTSEFLLEIVLPVGTIALVGALVRLVLGRLIGALGRRGQLSEEQRGLLARLATWVIVITVLTGAGLAAGINFGGVWVTVATLATAGLIAFFAAWSLLSSMLASVLILVNRPFRVGDEVRVLPEDVTGVVREINLFFTVMQSADDSRIVVPNNQLLGKVLTVRRKAQR